MKRFLAVIGIIAIMVLLGIGPAILEAGAAEKVTAAITAQNTWTDSITPNNVKSAGGTVDANLMDYGTLSLSITGTWVGTVTLQAAYDFGTAWLTTGEEFTANTTKIITCYEPGVSFRAGIATGDYTSGTCNVRLSK